MFNLSGITDFISSYITDSLKRVIQPAVLFSAAIFVLLNFLFIYQGLLKTNLTAAIYFRDVGTIWQAIFITLVIFILAYVLSGFQSSIMKFFTGELWSDMYFLAERLRKSQKNLRDGGYQAKDDEKWMESKMAENKFKIDTQEEEKWLEYLLIIRKKIWEKRTKFPQEKGHLAPTALGNVIAAISSTIWQKYRIDMALFWPHMELVLEKEDEKLFKRINDEKATLDFLINVAFILILFALEFLLLQFALMDSLSKVIILLLVLTLLYYVFYKAAIGKARIWGQALQMAFDYHRGALRTKLGLRDIKSRTDERELFRSVSRWLQGGTESGEIVKDATEYPYDDLKGRKEWLEDFHFKDGVAKRAPTKATVIVKSANVATELISTQIEKSAEWLLQKPQTVPSPTIMLYKELFEYVIFLNNAGVKDANKHQPVADGVHFIIADPRVPWIWRPIIDITWSGENGPDYKIQYTGKTTPGHQLLWNVSKLPPNGARLLTYRLPRVEFLARANNTQLVLTHKGPLKRRLSGASTNFYFEIKNSGNTAVDDTVLDLYRFDSKGQALPIQAYDVQLDSKILTKDKISDLKSPHGKRFALGSVNANETANLTFQANLK